MSQFGKAFLQDAIYIEALEFIPELRKLKSGRLSPYFFNSGLFHSGRSLNQLATAYAEELFLQGPRTIDKSVLFGPAYKGIPLVSAIATVLYERRRLSVGYAFNRKEKKDHGEGGILAGYPLRGKEVIIIDDVITTGGSSGEAIELIRAAGGVPIGCVIAFDRQERGFENDLSAVQVFEEKYIIPVNPVATFGDLIELFEVGSVPNATKTDIERMLPLLLEYRAQYGIK